MRPPISSVSSRRFSCRGVEGLSASCITGLLDCATVNGTVALATTSARVRHVNRGGRIASGIIRELQNWWNKTRTRQFSHQYKIFGGEEKHHVESSQSSIGSNVCDPCRIKCAIRPNRGKHCHHHQRERAGSAGCLGKQLLQRLQRTTR